MREITQTKDSTKQTFSSFGIGSLKRLGHILMAKISHESILCQEILQTILIAIRLTSSLSSSGDPAIFGEETV